MYLYFERKIGQNLRVLLDFYFLPNVNGLHYRSITDILSTLYKRV